MVVSLATSAFAQTSTGWKGNTSTDMQTSSNWDNGFGSNNNLFFGTAWVTAGRTGNTSVVNGSSYSGYRLNFQSITSPVTFTLSGSNITLFDFGGNEAQINNSSTANQQINLNVVFKPGGSGGSINATSGNLTFGATAGASTGKVFLDSGNGNFQLNLAGGSGNTILFNAAVNNQNGANGLRTAVTGNVNVTFAGGLTGAGDFLKQGTGTALFTTNTSNFGGGTNNVFMDQGTVAVGSGGSIGTTNGTTTGLINMGSSGTGGLNTTVNIVDAGVTLQNPIVVRYLQTGGKTISGSFTSGTSTYSGTISLSDHVSLNQAAGGLLKFSSVISQASGTLSGTPGAGNIVNTSPQAGNSFSVNGPGVLVNSTGGTGTVEFDANNTYLGDTVVQGGTLQFAGSGNGSSTIRLGNSSGSASATVNISDGHAVSSTVNVRPGSGGTKTISGTNGSGTTATYSGHMAMDDNATVTSTTAGATLSFTQARLDASDTTKGFDIKNKILTITGAGDVTIGAGTSSFGTIYNSGGGGGSVVMNGSGTLFLNDSANSYTGGTTINSGILKVSDTGGLGATGSNVVINAGTLEIAAAGASASSKNYSLGNAASTIQTDTGVDLTLNNALTNAAGTGTLNKTGAGKLTLAGASTYSGGTNLNVGALALGTSDVVSGGVITTGPVGTGTLTLVNGTTLSSDSTTSRTIHNNVSASGAITLGDATNTGLLGFSASGLTTPSTFALTADATLNALSNVNLSQAVTGAFTLTKSGSGSVALNTANSYSGGTIISQGTLSLNNSGALGSTTASVTVNGGSLAIQGTSPTIGVLSGSGGSVQNVGFPSGSLTIGNGNGSGSYAGTISNGAGGGILSLVKTGSGSETFTGSNTYTGGTTINAGTLALGNATDTLADSGAVMVGGGTLSIGANSDTVGAVTLTSGSITGSGGTLTGSSYGVQSGNVSAILGGGANLTKSTGGTVVLTGANTYTGTTIINGGTLTAGAANALGGTSSVAINTGGTLLLADGSTTNHINNSATMILNGGTFNTAGLSENGSVGMGALSLTSSSVIDLAAGASIINFAASNAQSWSGTLSIWNWSGTATLGGGTDQLIFGTNTSSLTMAQLNAINFYSDAGSTLLGGGGGLFATSNNGEVVPTFVTAVPEPSTWFAGTLVAASLVFSQRRRFKKLAA